MLETMYIQSYVDVDNNQIGKVLSSAKEEDWMEILRHIDTNTSMIALFKSLSKDIEKHKKDYEEFAFYLTKEEKEIFKGMFE